MSTDKLELFGGIRDGLVIDRPDGCVFVVIPEGPFPAKREPTKHDVAIFDSIGLFVMWEDPDCNPTFVKHTYNAMSGVYIGANQ